MIHETGNRLLDAAERKIGNLALPQILRWVAGFQVLSWGLSLFSPEFLEWIQYDTAAILSGEVWRLLSWVVYPVSSNVLFVLIALLFMFFINDSIEGAWGSFRLNVYVLASVLALALIGLIPIFAGAGAFFGGIFYSTAFLAFATMFPNQTIHLFAIIPIKAKWLGIANAALLLGMVLNSTAPVLLAIVVLAGMAPYFVVFVPTMISNARQRSESAVRRHKFQQEAVGDDEPFHHCDSCGATDESHPTRDFRVSGDGREYCSECRSNAS